jgi:hypothetical protein
MRKELQEELNRINELYHQYDLELRKAGGDDFQRQKMRDMLNKKKQDVISSMGDDLQKLNLGKSKVVSGGTLTRNMKDLNEKIDHPLVSKNTLNKKSFAQTKAKMMPALSNLSLGADIVQGNYDEAAESALLQAAQKAPSAAVSALGKVAPKIAAGLAAPAAGLGMLVGEAVASEDVGKGSDTGAISAQQERDVELVRDISKDDEQMNSARFKALQRMMGK